MSTLWEEAMWRRGAYPFEHLGRSRVHGGCPHYIIIQIEPVSMATVKTEPFRLPAVGREGVIPIPPQLWIQHLAHMVCHAPRVFPLVTDWAGQTLFNGRCLSGGWLCLSSAFLPLSFIHDRLTSWSRSLLGSPPSSHFWSRCFLQNISSCLLLF